MQRLNNRNNADILDHLNSSFSLKNSDIESVLNNFTGFYNKGTKESYEEEESAISTEGINK